MSVDFQFLFCQKALWNLLLEEDRRDSEIFWRARSSENDSSFTFKCSESEESDRILMSRHAIVRAVGKAFLFSLLKLSLYDINCKNGNSVVQIILVWSGFFSLNYFLSCL